MKAKDLKVGDTIYLVFEGNQWSPRTITKIGVTELSSGNLISITITSPYHRKDGIDLVVEEDAMFVGDVESRFAFVACFDEDTMKAAKFCFKPAEYKIETIPNVFSGKDIMELMMEVEWAKKNDTDENGLKIY